MIKQPKSYAGNRYIDYPDFVAKKWEGVTGRIVPLNPANISDRFQIILKHAGVPHFRFHDLRHYSASIQHALGIPDAYIMQRGGWSSDGVLKGVYRHALSNKTSEMSDVANHYFFPNYATRNATRKADNTEFMRFLCLFRQVQVLLSAVQKNPVFTRNGVFTGFLSFDRIQIFMQYSPFDKRYNVFRTSMQHEIKFCCFQQLFCLHLVPAVLFLIHYQSNAHFYLSGIFVK